MRSIKIPDKDYKALKALAKERGCFITKVLSEAVNHYMRYQKP